MMDNKQKANAIRSGVNVLKALVDALAANSNKGNSTRKIDNANLSGVPIAVVPAPAPAPAKKGCVPCSRRVS